MHTKLWSETLKKRGHFGHIGVDGRMILKLILKERDVWM
jgi:hypothetical protein